MDTKLKNWRRDEVIKQLQSQKDFDVVVIGGGATGLGVAVDAASRGLSVLVLESQDFCAGTSSRSTKLIHGGVRHLGNPLQWPRIRESLFERRLLLQNAPQTVRAQTFIVPCYSYLKVACIGLGLGLYNLMSSGGRGLHGVAAIGRVGAMGSSRGSSERASRRPLPIRTRSLTTRGLALRFCARPSPTARLRSTTRRWST